MSQTYTIEDFQEYVPIFENMEHPIDFYKFLDDLNYVLSEQEQVCDFYVMMKQISNINKTFYTKIVTILNHKENNTLSLYLYFKFLLLDEETKILYIKKYFDIIKSLNSLMNPEKIYQKKDDIFAMMREHLTIIYELVNDIVIDDFYDYTDNFNNYRRFDINKIFELDFDERYMNEEFIQFFFTCSRTYFRMKTISKLIYCISDKTNISILDIEETSISGCEDFIRRVIKNIDTFFILYNYLYNVYGVEIHRRNLDTESIEKIIREIPTHCRKIPTKLNETLDDCKRLFLIKKMLHEMICSIDLKPSYNSYLEESDEILKIFLRAKFEYNDKEDIYNIFTYNCYNQVHSKILFDKFISYKQSKLYKALNNIDLISCLMLTYYFKDNKQIVNLKRELSDFLKEVVNEFYFERHLYYINY